MVTSRYAKIEAYLQVRLTQISLDGFLAGDQCARILAIVGE